MDNQFHLKDAVRRQVWAPKKSEHYPDGTSFISTTVTYKASADIRNAILL